MARQAIVYYAILIVTSAICCKSGYAQDPGQLTAKALSCFNTNVYSRCDKAYRLTQSGYLNVPSAATDQFCYGPCLAETHLVLDCVDHSFSNFIFYNKATINDIRATLKAACGHEHERGNFNVEGYMQDYLQGEWSSADLPLPNNLFTLIFVSLVPILMIRGAL